VREAIKRLSLLAIAAACIPCVATAEVLGPLLPARTLEIGVMERRVNRVMEPDNNELFEWNAEDYPVTIRYGVTASATLSLELSGNPNGMFFDVDVVQYTVGAGIATMVWSHGEFVLSTGAHYYRRLDVYREPGYCDKITQGIDWTLLGQREFRVGRVDGSIWGGPTVSYLILDDEPPCFEQSITPDQVWGGVAGMTLLSRIGFVLQGSYVWVGESEYRINLAYRF
jgi:hypothetical protein